MSGKKLGVQGMVVHSQTREIINNVRKFMHEEAKTGLKIPLKSYRKRVLEATGVSKNTYQNIAKQSHDIETGASSSFTSPKKKRARHFPVLEEISVEEIKAIRTLIYDFYITEKRTPTLNCILKKMNDGLFFFSGGKTSLWRLLKKIGFSWKKTEGKHKILMESYDIRLKRINFLRKMLQYRAENWNIIYTDETYIHSSHAQSKGWYDDSDKGLKIPVTKGRRLIIVHAGGENGFVPNDLLIFKSGLKSGDYHDDMNHTNFMKWVRTQLLPNLPERSVLVVDNASYHNAFSQPSITSAACKVEMISWLRERNVPCHESMTKPELYNIIKEKKINEEVRYSLDDLLESRGHKVLRLPPYHPELNPIEKVWAMVKNEVAAHNVTFRLEDVEKLTKEKFEAVGPDGWKKICDHVKNYEEELIEKEHLMDQTFDCMKFNVNTGSSDDDLSGIEELSSNDESFEENIN